MKSNKLFKLRSKILKVFIFVFICCLLPVKVCFAGGDKLFVIKAKKFVYTPNMINVNKGDRVKIRLVSEDVTHGMYIDGYGLETKTHPGQAGNISFTADKTGRFAFRCSVTCGEFHPYMIGYLYVGPNYRFWTFIFLTFILGAGMLLILRKRSKVG